MKPILCNYYLTYRCNSQCLFCEIWQNPQYTHFPDAISDDIFANLSSLKKLGVRFIDFTGGEPLLYPKLPVVLEYANKLGFYTSITTNCILYKKRAESLRRLVHFLHFSLDAMAPEIHNELRGIPTFHQVMESIKIAKELNERPDLLFTVTERNYLQLKELWTFCKSNQLMLIVNPVFGYGNIDKMPDSLLTYLEQFQNKPFIYINRALHYFRKKGGNRIDNPRCRAVNSTITISPDNKLILPCFHQKLEQIPIKPDLITVMNSTAYQNYRKSEGRFSFCEGCSINCYFDPSFTQQFDKYFLLSILSKAKYVFDKHILSKIFSIQNRNI
ncbi:radical SAM protein [candidate division KSB1 bacterium]|nr:radical SAM protein [candidate division KSB1 bacterium]